MLSAVFFAVGAQKKQIYNNDADVQGKKAREELFADYNVSFFLVLSFIFLEKSEKKTKIRNPPTARVKNVAPPRATVVLAKLKGQRSRR